MGTSHPESRPWILEKINEAGIQSILDVGAGSGTYSDAFSEAGMSFEILNAIEVWQPYIEEFKLKNKYNFVYEGDVRDHDHFFYDLIIFGDILEHMSVSDALEVWNKVSKQADYAVISIPIIHYHQGEINGNPYERHVKDDWSHEEVLLTFPGIVDCWQGEVVGAYWAKFR